MALKNRIITLLAMVFLPRLPQHTHPGLRPNGLFPRQSFHAAKGWRLCHRLGKYLDSLAPLRMRYAVRHFRATSRAVEGLEAASHEVNVKGTINTTAVGHNRDSGIQADGCLLRWHREAWWKTDRKTSIKSVKSRLNYTRLDIHPTKTFSQECCNVFRKQWQYFF